MLGAGGLIATQLTHRKLPLVVPLGFFLAGLVYAQSLALIQVQSNVTSVAQLSTDIRIDSLPRVSPQKVSFVGADLVNNRRYLLNWYQQPGVKTPDFIPGNIHHMEIRLKPPNGTANGVGFDRERWLFRHHIDGLGSIHTERLVGSSQHLTAWINRWRDNLSGKLDHLFTQPKVNALVHALSLGDKSHFDQQDFKRFQATGTAHLIAISGLHIGMVAYFGWLLGAMLFKLIPQQRLPKPIIQVLIGISCAAFYASLAGWSVSTQRAMIMLSLYGLFLAVRRASHAWDIWALSLLLVLLFDPFNVLDAGFWLSFIAVAVLIFAFSGQRRHHTKWHTFIKVQFILFLGMLPLNVAVFKKLSLLAPVVNLLMIPLMTFCLIPALLLLLLLTTLFNFSPAWLVDCIAWISAGFTHLLTWFAQFSDFSISLNILYGWQYLLLGLGALVMIMPAVVPQRLIGIGIVLLALLVPDKKLPSGHFNADILDVGQGLSVLITTANHHLLYDVGAAYDSGFNLADATVVPYLDSQNVQQLDALVLSHQDNDHAGAADYLLAQKAVLKLWSTEPQHSLCTAGFSWRWDGVDFTFLSPYNVTPYLKNNSSCVLKISNGKHSILLTGDIEKPVEFRLAKLPKDEIQADVLVVPHHGSNTSSSEPFLSTVKPRLAINSSGQYNPFNHPASKVTARYQMMKIPFIDTQNSGLISLTTFPSLKVSEFRLEKQQIWRKKKPE